MKFGNPKNLHYDPRLPGVRLLAHAVSSRRVSELLLAYWIGRFESHEVIGLTEEERPGRLVRN